MRTITAHLLEYTLVNHSDNNKSELARMLGIRRTDFNRVYERCMRGEGGSHTTIEALLRLYYNEGYSLDEALSEYAEAGGDLKNMGNIRQDCEEKSRQMRMRISSDSKAADRRAQVLRSAEQMMVQMERAFCSNGCSDGSSCANDCPCQKFCDFVDWMKSCLDEIAPGKV